MEDTLNHLLSQSSGLITHKQATALGIDAHLLGRWVREGRLERVQRGVYRQVNAPPSGFEDLVEVQLRIPYAVVCLRSALSFHQLTTFIPKAVEIAVPQKARPAGRAGAGGGGGEQPGEVGGAHPCQCPC